MKEPIRMEPRSKPHAHILRKLLLLLTFLCALPLLLLAAPPDWWSNQDVTNTNPADDYAVANIGQVKNIASKARDAFNASLTGGGGTVINDLVNSWSQAQGTGVTRNDYAPITVGQLKTLAEPFYDRLIQAGLVSSYPWANSIITSDDFAAANLGQVKQLFSFDLNPALIAGDYPDSDGDGYPDDAEISRGSLSNDASSVPAPDIALQPPTSTDPHPVQDAIDALAYQEIDYGVIKLTAGNYPEHLQITDHPVIFIGDGSYPGPSLDGEHSGRVIQTTKNCAFVGIRIINGASDYGGGIRVVYSKVRFTNCIFQDNEADHGGAIALQGSKARLQNCTLFKNVGNIDASGVHISGSASQLYAYSSIFWNELNNDSPSTEIKNQSSGALYFLQCDIRGSYTFFRDSNFHLDPELNYYGRLVANSPCINAFASIPETPVNDIDHELRNDGFADIGADEYQDSDNNFLPDAWESQFATGWLGTWYDDPDNNGVINFDEYRFGPDAEVSDFTPDSLLAEAIGPNRINLSWHQKGLTSAFSYLVERKITGASFEQIAEVSDPAQYIDQATQPSTEYTYRIRTKYGTNVSSYSNEISTITPASQSVIPLSGLKLWLRADSIHQAPGTSISVWPDQSGNNNHGFQNTVTRRPFYESEGAHGHPTVSFPSLPNVYRAYFNPDPNDYFFNSSYSLQGQQIDLPNFLETKTSGEIFVLVRDFDETLDVYRVGLMSFGQGTDFGSAQSRIVPTPERLKGRFKIYNSVSLSYLWEERQNGLTILKDNLNTVKFRSNPHIGGLGSMTSGDDFPFWGDISEVVVYDRKLSSKERLQIGQYMASKIGLMTPPEAPQDLAAVSVSSHAISLGWSGGGQNDVFFTVERKVGSGPFVEIAKEVRETGYLDTSVIPRVSYTYKVKTVSFGGESAYSDELSQDTADTALIPLIALSVSATTATQINLTWMASSGVNASSYILERATWDGQFSTLATVPNASSFTDSNILTGVTYRYRIKALNTSNATLFSTEAAGVGGDPLLIDTDGDGTPDNLDAYPFDPSRTSFAEDNTPDDGPELTLTGPSGATLLP